MAKQESYIQMGAYFLNGRRYNNASGNYEDEFTPFNGYPQSYAIWNVNYKAEKEFLTSATTKSLTGYERGNPSGYRVKISIALKNSNASQSNAIRSLISTTSSQYERAVVQSTLGTSPVTGATINLALGDTTPNTLSNAYQGAYIRNTSNTSANVYRIESYVGATKVATAPENIVGYTVSDVVNVALFPDKPTVIGVSVDNTTSNIIYCNLLGGSYGIEREMTIGNQIISLDLASVDRYQNIPTYLNL